MASLKVCAFVPLLFVTSSVAAAQDLPAEVLLLARIKAHLREQMAVVPNYTCLETVSRFVAEHGTQLKSPAKMTPLDTVRLEIVYSDGHEWYGSPGDRDMAVDNLMTLVGGGMMGNGAFASTLNNVISGALFTWVGEETAGGRKSLRYDFRLARSAQALEVSIRGGAGNVGEEGSLWVDAESLDLIRIESHATEIPARLPLEEASSTVSYAPVRIGGGNVLLAQQADMHMLESRGTESYDRIDFSHCRSYSTEAGIRFDARQRGRVNRRPGCRQRGTPGEGGSSRRVSRSRTNSPSGALSGRCNVHRGAGVYGSESARRRDRTVLCGHSEHGQEPADQASAYGTHGCEPDRQRDLKERNRNPA